MTGHKIRTREEWTAARGALLEREKELTRMGDELARLRRELPWVAVEKRYTFETSDGPKAMAELFDGRSQLAVYHFMFGPAYEAPCKTCSSIADSFSGVIAHLKARDVTMLVVSRAPLEKLLPCQERMGWSFLWVSSADDFNFDLGFSSSVEATREWADPITDQLPPIAAQNARASGTDVATYLSETQGFSVFAREGDTIYHCYSAGARGVEFLMGYYPILDRTPKGRDENGAFQTWIRPHDEYDNT